MRSWSVGFGLFVSLFLTACQSNVTISRIDLDRTFELSQVSAVSADDLSPRTKYFAQQFGEIEPIELKIEALIQRMHQDLVKERQRDAAFALAELSFLRHKQCLPGTKKWLKAIHSAQQYAYAFLFDKQLLPAVNVFDPRFRQACAIYNQSLAKSIIESQKKEDGPRNQIQETICGEVYLTFSASTLQFASRNFLKLLVTYEYQVKDLEFRNETYGLGVPCIAVGRSAKSVLRDQDQDSIRIQQSAAATVFARYQGSIVEVVDKPQRIQVDVFNPLRTQETEVHGQRVALETDLSTPLAHMFAFSQTPSFIGNFLAAEEINDRQEGLYMLEPYQEGKIPVVFVHGLVSSPQTWLFVINALLADPEIRSRYQFWFYFYPTYRPILSSAAHLRRTLNLARKQFRSPKSQVAFDQTVLVGHSMGGVLSRLQVQTSGQKLWQVVSRNAVEDLQLNEEIEGEIREAFYFEPVKQVRRVIFLAAPHRGSKLAQGVLGRFASRFIELPRKTLAGFREVLSALRQRGETPKGLPPGSLNEDIDDLIPTSIRDLNPDNPVMKVAVQLPISQRVQYHSIMGDTDKAGATDGSDSIVSYLSAYLPGALSNLTVKSGHNVQEARETIEEIRRILRLHLKVVSAKSEGGSESQK